MRFITQRDHVSCGPVAAINVTKALGGHLTRKNLPAISRTIKERRDGTDDHKLITFLRKSYLCRFTNSLRDLDACLIEGGAAILTYFCEDGHWHYATVAAACDNRYLITNLWRHTKKNAAASHVLARSYVHQWTSREELKMHRNRKDRSGLFGWFILVRKKV